MPAAKLIFKRMLEIEQEMYEQKPHYPLYVKVLLESIFCELLRSFQGADGTQTKLASRKDLYNIDKTLHYINFNLSEHMTLNDLAAIAHVSPAYFSSIFKRCMGISLFEYIAQAARRHRLPAYPYLFQDAHRNFPGVRLQQLHQFHQHIPKVCRLFPVGLPPLSAGVRRRCPLSTGPGCSI